MNRKVETLRHRYATVAALRAAARRRVPRFAFDYVDGNAGDEFCARRNVEALAAVEMLPRYSVELEGLSLETEVFGRVYSAPFGVAPMGFPSMTWPGAEAYIAAEAQRRRVPYVLATPSSATIEAIARIAPDVFWFQLYRFPRDDHAISRDLARRASEAGAHVLVMTVDTAPGSKRPRDLRNGIDLRAAFRIGPRALGQIVARPAWLMQLWRQGIPRLDNLAAYAAGADRAAVDGVMGRESGGSHRWEEIARMRDRWNKPLVLKGILHPRDAERAVGLGVDGILVSNHGGRNYDGAPASVDMLPAVCEAVAGRATVLFDSGVRGGLDVARVLALGARAAFIGRPMLYGIGALGGDGARHVLDMFFEEVRAAFAHLGARSVAEAAAADTRHPGAWRI